jgi:hypothetical protein
MPENKQGAIIIGSETIFECIIEKKIYNVKDHQPYFVQIHTTFNVIPGKIMGGKGQLIPILQLVPVCEKCFNDPQYHFEKPEKIEGMNEIDPKKEKIRTTVADIAGLRRN